MKLVVFDLDGTLTRTSRVDAECYVQALLEVAGVRDPRTDWSTYEHATDTGIIEEIYRERLGRSPRAEEIRNIQAALLKLFESRCARDGSEFAEVPGAAAFLRRLPEEGWMAAVATGAWRCSAGFKIARSGIPVAEMPAAYAEDGPSREAIVRAAIERAGERSGRRGFERIVLVGDGLWDLRAARKLDLPFLGVALAEAASLLLEHGASHTIEDYLDPVAVLRSMEQAQAPLTR